MSPLATWRSVVPAVTVNQSSVTISASLKLSNRANNASDTFLTLANTGICAAAFPAARGDHSNISGSK